MRDPAPTAKKSIYMSHRRRYRRRHCHCHCRRRRRGGSTRITVAFIPAVFLEYAERALLFRRTVLSYCSYLLS